MNLSDELQQAAHNLGHCLFETSDVEIYHKAALAVKDDSKAVAIEEKFNTLYLQLASKERSGQSLDQSELSDYYQLREQVRENQLIAMREEQLQMVKLLFADTAQTMTSILGIDFTILAL